MRVITHANANGFTVQLERPSDIVLQFDADTFLSADGQRRVTRRGSIILEAVCSIWDGDTWRDSNYLPIESMWSNAMTWLATGELNPHWRGVP